MNNDLISRSELLERSMPAREFARNCLDLHVVSANSVRRAPAVEAEPVRHGRWNIINDGRGGELLECSNCRYTFRRLFPRYYCPNCGAKMDLEERE